MTSPRRRPTLALLGAMLAASVCAGVSTCGAAEADPGALIELRRELATIDAELRRVEVRSDSLRARAEQVAIELAALEREPSLGPVKRAQLSLYRQESQTLADARAELERERAQLDRRYRRIAERLLPLLDPAIDAARAAYEAEPDESEARARYFRIFEGLVRERRALRTKLSPSGSFLLLDIAIEPEDTVADLRTKVELAADNRDLLVRFLSRLSSWKRELEIDRGVLSDWRKLREENEFFNQTDPVAPSHVRDLPPGLGAGDVVPRELAAIADRLDVPAGGLATDEDYARLIESVSRLEAELEDEILAMNENQKIIEAEIARRGGQE